jgi:hypothetical protein
MDIAIARPFPVRRVAQIESQKRVIHSRQEDRAQVRMTREFPQIVRPESVDKIGLAGE